ncbi:hypothetical protein AUK04_03950 [Candidatus Roizmanbacteria bacterium CG2_30_33_16]|uniref:Glycosyltransferase RgtA/B/C/D-like domain-containing protein n=2 Tax=Candidatus Roizmaniibacteriota TaxID=1752723 RepID=A0A1J5HCN3_9BACT|nr:MAG: hypothetical protein AUK04_03950 [Candidatus Roizmanbacteria bacterium CG2_30_33_16]
MLYFLISRVIDLIIARIASMFIPYLGFFPYKEIFSDYKLPSFISSFANFDGAQYLIIIREGYNNLTQAYFPLYPLFVKFLSPLFSNNHLLTGLLLSNLSFLIALKLFKQFNNINNLTILFLLLFPTSFFFGALYTEGLFFLLVILVLWGLQKKKYWLVAIAGFLAALTRLIGVFLIIPIGFHIINQYQISKIKNQNHSLKVKDKNNTHISPVTGYKFHGFNVTRYTLHVSRFFHLLTTIYYLLTPILGLLTYMTYLWKTTGDPLFFFNSQPVFGANRSTYLIFLPQVYYRYFKIFLTATPDFQYLISMFEFIIFNFCLTILVISLVDSWRKFKGKDFRLWLSISNGLLLFSFINLLLPTLTGTFSSIPRYALMSLSVFIYLGEIKSGWIKIIIGCFFGILHVLILGFFIQGYFVG